MMKEWELRELLDHLKLVSELLPFVEQVDAPTEWGKCVQEIMANNDRLIKKMEDRQ